ncbi:HAMP domain-containing histidine kinase [Nodosilinea sp. LEGE 07088]|uniref:sensor histidine kinase n=1 Tax=Nodosilinea sp. LEGE 07088 TaxID=2777968 RepID=UPI0018821313|nr:HAMP domain-containing sensor histidine kinase [Nodosilinea sp. LEGE 07088]MBE9139067.1 HAMP domain-containing histidine kinase [Nodosilinea sp. LEGE 07088]
MRRSVRLNQRPAPAQLVWNWLRCQAQVVLSYLKSNPESSDYLTWRHQFFQQRLRLGLWLGLFWLLISGLHSVYYTVVEIEELRRHFLILLGDASIADAYRDVTIIFHLVAPSLMVICLLGQRTAWGRQHVAGLFLLFACSINELVGQIITTFYGIPITPGTQVFLAIAILIPVHWRLHLVAQSLPIAYYALVYPAIGLTTLGTTDTYRLYSTGKIIEIAWVCSVSILAVYLYERLKRSEFKAHRQLQVFLYSVSHDLQTPVVGTSIVLKSLLDQYPSGAEISIKRSVIERLLEGSDRQLTLIHSLIESHVTSIQGIILHRAPVEIGQLVDSVLVDLQQSLIKKKVQLTNHMAPGLPLVNADTNQLWRVFSNLIENALKHNPHGIHLTLDATVIEPQQRHQYLGHEKRESAAESIAIHHIQRCFKAPMLLCIVQDNGVGIAPDQCQRLFELYARGLRARYMPGLGLGLYICKQIITAHGGEIGVMSRLGEGSTFWFTLPLYPA